MTNSLISRVQIIAGGSLPNPGKCAVCGSTSNDCIDFGLELDFYGAVLFCVDNCFVQVANTVEWFSPSQVKILRQEISMLRRQNNQLMDVAEGYRDVVGSLRDIDAALSALRDMPSLSNETVDTESQPQLEFDYGDSSKADGADSEGKDGSVQQDDDDGLALLRDSDGVISELSSKI